MQRTGDLFLLVLQHVIAVVLIAMVLAAIILGIILIAWVPYKLWGI